MGVAGDSRISRKRAPTLILHLSEQRWRRRPCAAWREHYLPDGPWSLGKQPRRQTAVDGFPLNRNRCAIIYLQIASIINARLSATRCSWINKSGCLLSLSLAGCVEFLSCVRLRFSPVRLRYVVYCQCDGLFMRFYLSQLALRSNVLCNVYFFCCIHISKYNMAIEEMWTVLIHVIIKVLEINSLRIL